MIHELFTGRLWLLLLTQGTACLAVGLAVSYALRHRPARAHQVLLTALLAAVLMPTLYVAAGYYGLGLLASKPTVGGSTPAVARASWVPKRELIAFGDPSPCVSRASCPRSEGETPSALTRAGRVPKRDASRLGSPRPRHEGWAPDIRPLAGLPTTEAADEPPLLSAEPIGAIPAPVAATLDVPWSIVAILGWGVGTAILLARLILRFVLGLHLLWVGHPLESERLRRALDGARSRLGVVPPVGIRCSERVHSPVIWCWSREPILLMQTAASNGPEGTDWAGVFCHELAHWRRRDHLSGLFAELLVAVLPWHPLLWWTRGQLLKLSEQACDDWVLATGQNGVDYAEILLGLAAQRQMAFLPTVIGKEKTMHTRIRRIIQDKGSDPRLGTGWALAVGAVALCTTVGVAVAQRRAAGPEPMDPPPAKVSKERREIEVREPPEVDQQRTAMKRVLERLMKQADEKKEMLAKGAELPEEERLAQQIELKLLVAQIEQLKDRLEAPGRAPAKIAPQKTFEPEREARFDALRQGREELEQRAQKLEREIRGLRDDQDQEARELKSQLEQIRDKKVLVEKEIEELKLAQADDLKRRKLDDVKRAQVEIRREKAVREKQLLQDLRLRAEKIARALKENPDMDAEKATDLRKQLEETRAKIGAVEQESRDLKGNKEVLAPKREYRILKEDVKIEKKAPDESVRVIKGAAGNPQLEAEVQELRDQVKELHGQMQQMQKLLEQALERNRIDGPAK